MRRLAARLRCDERGLAAVEFAIAAPIMIVLHLGSVECVQAWEAYRRVSHIASAVADLTAQNSTVTKAQMQDIMTAGSVLMAPFSTTKLGVRVSSLNADSTGKVTIAWQTTSNYTVNDSPSVPTGYVAANQSVIVADVTYNLPSMFGLVLPATIKLEKHAYLQPRLSNQIPPPS